MKDTILGTAAVGEGQREDVYIFTWAPATAGAHENPCLLHVEGVRCMT